jgi:anti-anti-sigma factor
MMADDHKQPVLSFPPHEGILLATVECAEMDEDLTRQMQDSLIKAAEATPKVPVVLDLSKVTFAPSLTIGALVSFLTYFRQLDRRFILVGIQPHVRKVLTVIRLDQIFEICVNPDDALQHIR